MREVQWARWKADDAEGSMGGADLLRRMREVRCEAPCMAAAAAGGPIGGAELGCDGWGSSDGMARG